jgi:pilus assembly protein CpaB
MRPIVIILIAAALGIAVLTAVLAKRYLSNQAAEAAAQVAAEARPAQMPTSQILVATRDLPAGTVLKDSDMSWQPWPNDAVNRRYVVRTGNDDSRMAFVGATVRQAFVNGEPVVSSRVFRQDAAGFMSGIISPGKRAMGVPVSTQTMAGGFILPGDHVDLVLSAELKQGEGSSSVGSAPAIRKYWSETILEDIRVLAIDQKVDDIQSAAVAGTKTATLEVSPKEAEIIALFLNVGQVSLVLRSLVPEGETEVAPAASKERNFSSDVETSKGLSALYGAGRGRTPVPIPIFEDPAPEPIRPRARRPSNDDAPSGQVKIYRGPYSTTENFGR